jgi:uncharacterized RDD family membrane protein YckC
MFCPKCGAQSPDSAVFCPQCGNNLTPTVAPPPASGALQPPAGVPQRPRIEDLASLGQRIGSWLIDIIAGVIPLVNWAVAIGNWIGYRRGMTLGLKLAGARIMRENGDVSGFYHTAVRAIAATLSTIPLGLGFWWALWDPYRQTWHDKIMHTSSGKTPRSWRRGGAPALRER